MPDSVTLFWLWLGVVNVFGFSSAVRDKWAARRGLRRTPERRFVLYALLGGSPGVLLAFYTARHKTKHMKLLLTIWGLFALEAALIAFVLYPLL